MLSGDTMHSLQEFKGACARRDVGELGEVLLLADQRCHVDQTAAIGSCHRHKRSHGQKEAT